jgi:hypothetical protein
MKYMNFYRYRDMKRAAVMLIFILISSFLMVSAQNPNRERLDAYKIAFFTKKLNLSPQEAEKFWPVYNENQRQKSQIQAEKISLMKTVNMNEVSLTDKEVTDIGNRYCETLVKESELAVTFHKKLQEILPPVKVIRVYQAENQYRVQLLNELQQRRPLRNNIN